MATPRRILPEFSGSRERVIYHCWNIGKSDNGKATTIASGKLSVPAALWKVILVLPMGSDDINRINAQTRVIAVWMPNTNATAEGAWGSYRVSVDSIEKQIGYDLLLNVPTSIQQTIEAKTDIF